MQVKSTKKRQYARIVDGLTNALNNIENPAEGWLSTVRKAIGMSGPQLANRVGLTKGAIYQAERNELEGGISLKQMEKLATAMESRFVYAIVPNGSTDEVIFNQATLRANQIVAEAATHMGLEKQSLSSKHDKSEAARLARDIAESMPADLWD